MIRFFTTAIVLPSLMLFTLMTLWLPAAQAAMLGTGSADKQSQTASSTGTVEAFLSRDSVRQQLIALGVDPEMASVRAASLTTAERMELEQKIEQLPAGAGALEVIGIVFLVLLILELVGVTDIFKKI